MKRFIYFAIFILFSFSCGQKEKNLPIEPSIAFLQFDQITHDSLGVKVIDGADCIVSFKDGDGDVGVGSDSTLKPDFNMLYLYKGTDGQFHPYDKTPGTPVPFDTLYQTYRVPDLTPSGQYKALEGQIKAKLNAPYFGPGHKVFKYQVTLRDRAGHLSNMVETNEITAPQ